LTSYIVYDIIIPSRGDKPLKKGIDFMMILRFTDNHWQYTIATASAIRQYHIHDLGEEGYLVLDNCGNRVSIEDTLPLAQISAHEHFKTRSI